MRHRFPALFSRSLTPTTGEAYWASATGSSMAHGFALDGQGSVYVTGYFAGTADFDPGTAIANLNAPRRELQHARRLPPATE